MQDVEQFARQNDMNEIEPLLKKGALIAQSPADYETLDLGEDERDEREEACDGSGLVGGPGLSGAAGNIRGLTDGDGVRVA